MRRLWFCLLLAAAVVAGAMAAFSQDEGEKPDTEHTIYIPYKDLEKVFERTGRGV